MRLSMVGFEPRGRIYGEGSSGKYQPGLGRNRLGLPRTGL